MSTKIKTAIFGMVIGLYLVSAPQAKCQTNCAELIPGIQSKQRLIELASEKQPMQYRFIKDAPVLGYRIISNRFEDIPQAIVKHLGEVDQTKYTQDYLQQNIGSVFSLQMNGDKPDFYPIGRATFETKYRSVERVQVSQKNPKYLGKLNQHIPELLQGNDPNLIAVLKIVPVSMIRMSDLGYEINAKVVIESPWGQQTKPAGQDAYLVFDESKQQFYMVNSDANGLPLSYIHAP